MGRRLKTPALANGVVVEDRTASDVHVRIYRPAGLSGFVPALFWIHGGGFIAGRVEQDERSSAEFAHELGIVVVAVRYRLAPEHPFPAPLDDCYLALKWVFQDAGALGIDPSRIAIGGASAGGGLAAGLALMAHDRGEVTPVFQLLVYPMLDDRTTTRTDLDPANVRVWTVSSNRYGWTSYLGQISGGAGVSPYAAPARRASLSGLPPAWVGVGTLDLFHDEGVSYANRLAEAGVACELLVVPGAYHVFDWFSPQANVVKEFRASQVAALRRALSTPGDVLSSGATNAQPAPRSVLSLDAGVRTAGTRTRLGSRPI